MHVDGRYGKTGLRCERELRPPETAVSHDALGSIRQRLQCAGPSARFQTLSLLVGLERMKSRGSESAARAQAACGALTLIETGEVDDHRLYKQKKLPPSRRLYVLEAGRSRHIQSVSNTANVPFPTGEALKKTEPE